MLSERALGDAYASMLRAHVTLGAPLDELAQLEFACELLGSRVAPEDVAGFHRLAFDELRASGALVTPEAIDATNAFLIALLDAYSSIWNGLREQFAEVPLARAELAAAERIAMRLSRGKIATRASIEVIASRQLIAEGSCYEVRDAGQERVFAAVGIYNASGVLGAQILALLQYGARALVSAGASLDRLVDYLQGKLTATFSEPPSIDYCAVYLGLADGKIEVVSAGALAVSVIGQERKVLRGDPATLERVHGVSVQSHSIAAGEALVIAPGDSAERWLRPDRGAIRAQVRSLASSYDFEHQNALIIVR